MVEIENYSAVYQDGNHSLLALDRVTFSLNEGYITVLIGESGSGKTTMANAIMGLLPKNTVTEGSIRLNGDELTHLDDDSYRKLRWRTMAMVFQNSAAVLNPVQRIVNQVAEPLIYHLGIKKEEALQITEKKLAHMSISSDEMFRYPHELSGGQIQRTLFAMALILNPRVLILDEPTSAMDAALKAFMISLLKELKSKGTAILLITHDLDLAVKTADEAIMLYLGQIMEVLPARDLMQTLFHPCTVAMCRSFPTMDAVRDLGGMRGDAFYRYTHVHRLSDGKTEPHVHIAAGADREGGHAPILGCLFRPRCTQAVEECGRTSIQLTQAGTHKVRCVRGGIVDLLQLKQIKKAYGRITAVDNASVSLRAGEILTIVGETGSGKTTLAMIAAGAIEQDSGMRTFKDRTIDEWIKNERFSFASEVGIIYQNPAESVSHRFTVYDIVAEPLHIQNKSSGAAASKKRSGTQNEEERKKVLNALTDVHLPVEPDFLMRHPHELNMGAIQRLCIARALVHDPVLIVADEPTSALDPSVQAKVIKLLLNLQIEKGLTIIFVTHDIGVARKISDRICVMLAGRIVEIGPASKIINEPRHPYTELLIDSARGELIHFESPKSEQSVSPDGCPFANRCSRRVGKCLEMNPPCSNVQGQSHLFWCFNPVVLFSYDKKMRTDGEK
ncbi:MAG: ABC transporter ATP-binding protein [Syntrophales bacterium]|jgi:peptide/nickel transport system ATP-binding protein|nr:ABC transporter ATP-binding protein [Syntrophales bacterium]MDY0045296.1 ATP-binding cassette domain-containing protein [Syntrophales bacterium]